MRMVKRTAKKYNPFSIFYISQYCIDCSDRPPAYPSAGEPSAGEPGAGELRHGLASLDDSTSLELLDTDFLGLYSVMTTVTLLTVT
ncbi:hypothetical protein EVAR_79769_1 [Eumeta japonica]|uniref:Uncharacterized protein n=1 Tax=Eumeta variegata TaxID=151549 RepID=A0A4C1TCS8_EUMVA|nr:hypothetical protein EVAR_79769_1 [Eumeta japonica]